MSKFLSYLESVISGKRRGVLSAILKLGLLTISRIILIAVKLRRWLHFRGILRSRHLPCKVISVGNIVVGGSGKTPAVMAVANALKNHKNMNLAVLSRGYHSESHGSEVVSDNHGILLDAAKAGDEPYLLALSLPGTPVLIGKNRVRNGLAAVNKWNCQAIILDDAFQYLKLARDVDIVTVDATRPFGLNYEGFVIPRGYLREPLSALKYADIILLTRVDQCECLESLRARISEAAPSVPILESVHRPHSLRSLNTGEEVKPEALRERNVLAVCGIANPVSFVDTLKSLGAANVELLAFPDHHSYPSSSVEMIGKQVMETQVDLIVTTEKDAPKLVHDFHSPILSLKIKLELVNTTVENFVDLLII